MNNLNTPDNQEKDQREINIILGRLEGDNYCYLEDSAHDNSKIKIPLIYDNQESKTINEDSQLKEKSISGSNKFSNSIFSNNDKKTYGDLTQEERRKNELENFDTKEFKEMAFMDQKLNYLIPNSASWFKFDDIHEFEVKANPEFFNGKYPSKTSEVYKQYRNFIIVLYKENPEIYLSSTSKTL